MGMKSMRLWAVIGGVGLLSIGLCCQRRQAASEPTIIVIETEKKPQSTEPPPTPVADAPSPTPSWLVTPNNPGSGAEGSFDRKKNKITIRTADQRDFAVDTGQLPIDWDKLVILSIDGQNSELRRRDFRVYRFKLNDHGQWDVQESK
jgi:hypothetical protein